MSKIWLLLLFVGVIQLVQSFPALEEDVYDLEDSDEARGFNEWMKDQWQGLKSTYKKVKKIVIETMKKGRDCIKKKLLAFDEPKFDGKKCKLCINPAGKNKKYCANIIFAKGDTGNVMKVDVVKEKPDKEPEVMFKQVTIPLGKASSCVKCGDFMGKLCMQGVKGTGNNFAIGFVFKKWGIGFKVGVAKQEDGKYKMRLRPKFFPSDDDEGAVLQGHETKEDEAKMVDADEE